MTIHARQQIREAIYNLISPLTSFTTVHKIIDHKAFPSINITTENESLVDETMNGTQHRMLDVKIEIRAKQNIKIDDEMDGLAADIEIALEEDIQLGDSILAMTYQGMDMEFADFQEFPIGMLTMRYSTDYLINKTDPTVLL